MDLVGEIWNSRILTNNGAMVRRLESAIAERLDVEHVSLVANATVGAVVALRQLGISGEVVTTPFTFVATANAIRFAGAEPVFADIDPVTLNIDPREVERCITSRTSAIYAVHCYGIPCDFRALAEIGDRYGIPVIYDAAHAFDVRVDGESLLRHGTMSILSFHATKVFHTVEGGAIISRDAETKREVDRLCNHGISDETSVGHAGLNAKMSELHAAVGILQLRRLDQDIAARAAVARRYETALGDLPGVTCLCPADRPGHNQYAFPVMVDHDFPISRDELCIRLREEGIVARRYFYPIVPQFEAYRASAKLQGRRFPIAEAAAERVLCLPLYPELSIDDQSRIIDALWRAREPKRLSRSG